MKLIPNPVLAAFMAEHRLTFDRPTHAVMMAWATRIAMDLLVTKAGR